MNIASQSIENTTDDPLSAVTHEELVQCARLLAVSVAHHRAKFGVVPITTSGAQLGIDVANTADIALEHAAHTTLTEALDLVRRRAAEQVRTEPAGCEADTHVPVEEKRRQMRISVNTAVQVSDVHGQRVCPSTLRNISWGGAAIRCDEMPTDIGGRVVHQTLIEESDIDMYRVGLRFEHPDPRLRERVSTVINELAIMRPQDLPVDSNILEVISNEEKTGDADPE